MHAPLLQVTPGAGSKVVLFESAVINEYLDEVTEGSMLPADPADPLDRARARAWIERFDKMISRDWGGYQSVVGSSVTG